MDIQRIRGALAWRLGNAEHHNTEANRRLVIVLEERVGAPEQDAGVWPQALEVGRVSGVAAHQQHCRHLPHPPRHQSTALHAGWTSA